MNYYNSVTFMKDFGKSVKITEDYKDSKDKDFINFYYSNQDPVLESDPEQFMFLNRKNYMFFENFIKAMKFVESIAFINKTFLCIG